MHFILSVLERPSKDSFFVLSLIFVLPVFHEILVHLPDKKGTVNQSSFLSHFAMASRNLGTTVAPAREKFFNSPVVPVVPVVRDGYDGLMHVKWRSGDYRLISLDFQSEIWRVSKSKFAPTIMMRLPLRRYFWKYSFRSIWSRAISEV